MHREWRRSWRWRIAAFGLIPAQFALATSQSKTTSDGGPNDDKEQSLTIEVTAKRQLHNTAPVSRTEIKQEQIQELPRGEQISLPVLLVSTTPSVVQGPLGRVFIRQNENGLQYQVDGIQLPDLGSNTLEEIFDPRNIEKLDVLAGALPAEYGERPSGVISITTRSGAEETSGMAELNYGSFNTFSPQGILRGRLKEGKFKYFLSGNFHRTDRGLDTPEPASETHQNQGGSAVVHDYAYGNNEFGKIEWLLDNEDKLTLLLSNREEFYQIPNYPSSFQPTDGFFQPGFSDPFGNTGGFNYTPPGTADSQSEANVFSELVWRRTLSNRSFFQLGTFWQYFRVRVDNDPPNDLAALSLIPGSQPSSLFEDRHTNTAGIKGDYTFYASDAHTVKTGFQVKSAQTSGLVSVIGTNPSPPP